MQLSLPFFSAPTQSAQPVLNGSAYPQHAPLRKAVAHLPALEIGLQCARCSRLYRSIAQTLFRWVNNGRFPKRHKAGGWLRSDIEKC